MEQSEKSQDEVDSASQTQSPGQRDTGRASFFLKIFLRAFAMPFSLLERVMRSAAACTLASAFCMAMPSPAAFSMGMSFSESPKAIAWDGSMPRWRQMILQPQCVSVLEKTRKWPRRSQHQSYSLLLSSHQRFQRWEVNRFLVIVQCPVQIHGNQFIIHRYSPEKTAYPGLYL